MTDVIDVWSNLNCQLWWKVERDFAINNSFYDVRLELPEKKQAITTLSLIEEGKIKENLTQVKKGKRKLPFWISKNMYCEKLQFHSEILLYRK